MIEELINVLRYGGRAAAPLAVASWGFYFLPVTDGFRAPFGAISAWICIGAAAAGIFAASVQVIRAAFARADKRH